MSSILSPYPSYAKPFYSIGGVPQKQEKTSNQYVELYGQSVRRGPQGKQDRLRAASNVIKKAKDLGWKTNLNTGFSKSVLFSAATKAQQWLNHLEERKQKSKQIKDIGITIGKGETGYFQTGTTSKSSTRRYGTGSSGGRTTTVHSTIPVYGYRSPQTELEQIELLEKKFADQFKKEKSILSDIGIDISEEQYLYKPNQPEIKKLVSLSSEIKQKKQGWKPKGPEIIGDIGKLTIGELEEKKQNIFEQQQQRIKELEGMGEAEKYIGFELDLPLYKEKFDTIDARVQHVQKSVEKRLKERKPVEVDYTPESYKLEDLIGKRNELARMQQAKIQELESIEDPIEKEVIYMQDLPVYSTGAEMLDLDIEKYEKTLESRTPYDFEFPKVRRSLVGVKKLKDIYRQKKERQLAHIASIKDPIEKEVAEFQDMPTIEATGKELEDLKKFINKEKMQELESQNIGGAPIIFGGPDAPADTPIGVVGRVPRRGKQQIGSTLGLDASIDTGYDEKMFNYSYKEPKMPKVYTPREPKGFRNRGGRAPYEDFSFDRFVGGY